MDEHLLKNVYFFADIAGHSLPTFLVFTVPFDEGIVKFGSEDVVGTSIGEGDTDDDVLLKALQHFRDQVGCNRYSRVALVVHDRKLLKNRSLLQFCSENGVALYAFPKNRAEAVSPSNENSCVSLRTGFCQKWTEILALENAVVNIERLIRAFRDAYAEEFTPPKVLDAFRANKERRTRSPETASNSEMEEHHKNATSVTRDGSEKNLEDFEIKKFGSEKSRSQAKRTKTVQCRCRYCDAILENQKAVDEHEKTHVKGKMHCCPLCSQQCGSRAALIQHRRKHILRTNPIRDGDVENSS